MSDKPTYMKHMPHFLGPVAPITIDHAEGSWVYDTDGGKWLDFVVGIAVVNTGHCHPKVVKAVQEQAAKVAHAQMNIYRHGPMLELAEKLTGIMPEGMDEVMFANSGAEAVENAVKLAKQATRRPGIIAFQGAFHGRTHLTMALTDSAVHYRGHHEPLVGVDLPRPLLLPVPHAGRARIPTDYAIEDVRRVLRAEIYGDDVAAIIVEPIQGEGGFIVPTVEFMTELRAIADEIGACLIIDEIQAGFGRTGKWLCQEHYGVKADIVTVAKGIASGYPLAAIAANHELWDKCLPGSMGGTYGGNAVACAAGVATIDVMKDEGMLENATRQGEKLRKFFTDMQATYPCIGEVRGKGLMNAIECVVPGTKEPNAAAAKAFIAECNKRHLIIMGAGSFGNCVRFLPPLNISDADLDYAFEHLHRGREGRLRLSGSAHQLVAGGGALRRPAPFVMLDSSLVSTPAPSTSSFETRVRVRYEETDADGVVYYANYLTYFEVVRVEWLRALGYPIPRILAEGIILPVVEARLKYLRPARVDDLLTVRADRSPRSGPASFAFDYEVTREDGLLLVTGWTRLAVCERESARACAMPGWMRDLFAALPLTVQT